MMSSQPHILVIDDEPQILALRTILTAKHFRASVAAREEGWPWPRLKLPI
jgi:hypothetical protein